MCASDDDNNILNKTEVKQRVCIVANEKNSYVYFNNNIGMARMVVVNE